MSAFGKIARTYQTAYPNARILYASERDFSKQNRVRFFNNIKNNDYDCVVMSHDKVGFADLFYARQSTSKLGFTLTYRKGSAR